MKSAALLKWSPATPVKKQDNIISSKAREKNLLGFKPSYENEPREHMGLLMSNEYMRRWFTERAAFEKDTYTREKIIKEENKIKRRFVQRMMTYRKPTKNQFIEESIAKRKAVPGNSTQDDKAPNYEKMKYKTECLPLDHVKKPLKTVPGGKKNSGASKEDNEFIEEKTQEDSKKSPKSCNGEKSNVLEAEIVCGCPCPCE
ncbi:uncharacterized protein [Leptinotarsa decemlineata]|uniref:uncharacterized protein n=1 Tax=Leptinotarsa decemlineata TaxID=7539 RepID=UPI000C252552|nr:uncharacterized protein LOC111508709 [Leptinotarsa decemlineata]